MLSCIRGTWGCLSLSPSLLPPSLPLRLLACTTHCVLIEEHMHLLADKTTHSRLHERQQRGRGNERLSERMRGESGKNGAKVNLDCSLLPLLSLSPCLWLTRGTSCVCVSLSPSFPRIPCLLSRRRQTMRAARLRTAVCHYVSSFRRTKHPPANLIKRILRSLRYLSLCVSAPAIVSEGGVRVFCSVA